MTGFAHAAGRKFRKRWPQWKLRPKEQAGFHTWSGEAHSIIGDPAKLSGVGDSQLIAEAQKAADEGEFFEGDTWQAICQTDTPRALRGISAEAAAGRWPTWAWRPFLWAASKLEVDSVASVARLLREMPNDSFSEIATAASWWLNETTRTLDETLLWPLWDRIAEPFHCRKHRGG